jgi:hypothetical protein
MEADIVQLTNGIRIRVYFETKESIGRAIAHAVVLVKLELQTPTEHTSAPLSEFIAGCVLLNLTIFCVFVILYI